LGGVAVTGNAANSVTQGKWQWKANAVGAIWMDFSTVTDASALYLAANTSLRFLSNANYFGTPGDLSVRLVDSTAPLSNGSTVNVQSNGGTTAYSSSTVAVSISVSNVDDAPTGAVSFTGTASPGNLLTASNTLADLDGMGTVTYHWQTQTASVWSDVATGTTYTPTASDSGKSIRVHATYTDGGGKAESMDSGSSTVTADTTPPLLKSLSVYSTALMLGFDETLMGPTGGADVSSFTLTTYDSASRATTVNLTGVSVPGATPMYDKYNIQYGNLSMLSGPMYSLKLSYTDASGDDANALQDLSGNDMPSFNLIMFNGNANANATGTTGIDYIMGGGGNDTITGGKGNDVMWGLDSARSATTSDNDTFVWLSGDEGTGAVDTIKDFTVWNGTTGDKLNLTGLLSGYNSSFTITNWIKSVTTGQVVNGVTNSTVIAIDADGSGPSSYTQTINLEGVDLLNGVAGADLAAKLLALKSSGVIITA